MRTASRDFDWADDIIARLRKLWAEGHSAAEIGRRLGISKNAIIGKSHRLCLPARPSPIQRTCLERIVRPPRPRCPALAELQGKPPVTQPTNSQHVAGAQLTAPMPTSVQRLQPDVAQPTRTPRLSKHPCCWPIGDPGTKGFRFCEELSEAGKSYCPRHCVDAYIDRTKRRPAA